VTSLWDSLTESGGPIPGAFHGIDRSVRLASLSAATALDVPPGTLRGRSALIATKCQLAAALAIVELDGLVRRMVLCPPDLSATHLAFVASVAGADIVVHDAAEPIEVGGAITNVRASPELRAGRIDRRSTEPTEWVLLTSGTTGAPKLVAHSLPSLAGPLVDGSTRDSIGAWSTFYDIRRYGGLQIYLRAVLGRASLVLSCANEPTEAFLARVGRAGVTHISGTPSHWRRALMSGATTLIDPKYVRLSGEIADQAILDRLRDAFPRAQIAHAFASTEAGVAFDVTDGLAGFPARLIGDVAAPATMKVEDGTLRIRSRRTAARYLGSEAAPLSADDGFVDTGDMVELRGDRYHFAGRKGGVINVGGLKVHPEEVEAVINADSRVRMSLVRARHNPITGAVVVADVVLIDSAAPAAQAAVVDQLKRELLDACRQALPAHKVPAMLRIVPTLELTAAGKLVRPRA